MSLTFVTRPPELILSQQPVVFVIGSDAEELPLRISGGITGEAGDSVQADSQKHAAFELSDYLQGLITERHKTADTPSVYTGVPKPVEFEFGEHIGDPPVKSLDVLTSYHILLDGRIPRRMRREFYASHANLLAYLTSSKSCLTWFPYTEPKRVSKDQSEFINFMQVFDLENPCDLYVNIILNLDDGNTRVMVNVFSALNVNPFEILYIPVGYTQLGIEQYLSTWNQENDTWIWAKSYTVYIYNSGLDLLSQKYTFEIDEKYTQNARRLYIRNPFGMLETINCTGIGQQDNKYTMETLTTDGRILPDKINFRTSREAVVKCNTGHLTAKQMLWLSDIMDVEDYETLEAYEMIGEILHPIVFREVNLPLVHDGDYQYSAELEYEYAYNEITEHA